MLELFNLDVMYRGRTEYETVHKDGARLSRRHSSTFERKPSQRYGPRESHAVNRQIRREQFKQEVKESSEVNMTSGIAGGVDSVASE